MGSRSIQELRDELSRLMTEHLESLKDQTFLGAIDEGVFRLQEERLKRIREVSADYLAALKIRRDS